MGIFPDEKTTNIISYVLQSGIAGAIAQLSLESGGDSNSTAAASSAHQEYIRRQNWETGNMDYMGKDSFDNIWSKICQTIEDKVKVQIKKKVIYNNKMFFTQILLQN